MPIVPFSRASGGADHRGLHIRLIEYVCGSGALTRLAALALFVTLVPITLSIHIAPGHVGPLLKNVAILGGLVHFMVRGPGGYEPMPGRD